MANDPRSSAPAGAFADAWVARERRLGHPLCAGLDPHLDLIPPIFRRGSMEARDPATAAAVESLCVRFLDRVGDRVPILKPQIAFFERLGSAGLAALERLAARARAAGLLVLLDAKRGDIGSTAGAYAESYLGPDAPLEVDALTVNPYLGLDSLEPFLRLAGRHGRGLFVLARTSNPGARDFQDLESAGGPLFAEVAGRLAPSCAAMAGAHGFSSLGVVVGATHPDDAPRVRELLPQALFLIPGYGAQGASARQAVAGLVRGAGGRLEGGLVSASRALLFPEAASRASSASAWDAAVDEALERAIGELGDAVA